MTPTTLNHAESKCVLANLKHELAPKNTILFPPHSVMTPLALKGGT